MDTETKPMHPSHVLAISILLAAAIISGTLLYTVDRPADRGTADIGQVPTQPPAVVEVEVADNDHVLGDPNAPVTIVEFSDFQCPFCRSFYQGAYQQIKDQYVDSGDVQIVFKHLPLPFHQAAVISAEVTECAADQGMFWEMHDKIFDEQIPLGNGTIDYGEAELLQWAEEIGLNMDEFNQCLANGTYAQKVADDEAYASQLGASGTPTFFINGRRIVGALPFTSFQEIIESEL